MGSVRALQSQMLFDEVVTLGATHTAAALPFRTGVNLGFDGLTSIVWAGGPGLPSTRLALLHLRPVRSSNVLAIQEQMRRIHYKFKGDAKLASAMKDAEVIIRKVAEMNAVPAWWNVGRPFQTAISVECSYFYANAVKPFSDGGASRNWDLMDCTSAVDLVFDQVKNKIEEAVQPEDSTQKGLMKTGLQLDAINAVVKGTKTVKSTVYKAISAQQKAIQAHLAKEKPDVVWGSNKGNKMVHAIAMNVSAGESLYLPSGETPKRGAATWRTSDDASKPGTRKKGCQVKQQARDVLRQAL